MCNFNQVDGHMPQYVKHLKLQAPEESVLR